MRSERWYTPWLLIGPAVIWVLVFSIFPFLNTIVLSFTDSRPLSGGAFIGLENYVRLFDDRLFWNAIATTFVYVIVSVPLLTFIPLGVALLVEKRVPGISFFRTVAYFPVIASVVVVALIWTWMFSSRGIVNEAMKFVGLIQDSVPFLVDRWLVVFCAILLTVWKGLGYYMVVYLAALTSVSPELHEAAALDGASTWKRFLHVTIPGVRGAMMLVSALIAVAAMRIFSEMDILTGGTGGPGGESITIVMLVRQVGSGLNGQTGYASAISVVLFFLTLIPLLTIAWMNNRNKEGAR
ncbi:sugar ABC transporter permease [Ruania alkalisoli]|uniref:Sugar ABC transporter permease n=1 Tax=Ruania alkalisoli TaxID=2779775 RepID=A0A7M1SQR2_9MICO|nr:sugar ABC transporter permease [Ruania alkalisoli]QOR69906.1 sugar ABC transporter permease [Ruania alkalisoli]